MSWIRYRRADTGGILHDLVSPKTSSRCTGRRTTKLIGLGVTLIKARRTVPLDPDWLLRDELQARKRVNRISQTSQTYTYSLLRDGAVAEGLIFDRQNRREILVKLALESTELEVRDIVKGIRDSYLRTMMFGLGRRFRLQQTKRQKMPQALEWFKILIWGLYSSQRWCAHT